MDILVCVKQVPDDYVEVHLDPSTHKPATGEIEQVANAFDTYAVELAVRYCEEHGGSVTVASIGPESVKNTLKNLLAVGAAKAYLFSDPVLENADAFATASYLGSIIKKCETENGAPFGMILCGKESTDEISGQVGAMLAENLKLGFVCDVVEIAPREGGFTVKQETDEGFALYETASPSVFTIAKPGYDPRYPSIKTKMAARRTEVPIFSAAEAAIIFVDSRITCLDYIKPPKRETGVMIQEKVAVDAVRKAISIMVEDKVL
jgi:electron transfer flavoprotein beta subunit